MNIQLANTDKEIQACFPVMYELRPHLTADEFIQRVRQQEKAGYSLVFLSQQENIPLALAGFRIGENLAWGKFLYVDDWVTLPKHRSQGYGAQLFMWLKEYGVKQGCQQLHLDSGLQRLEAHRFYEQQHIKKTGFHFATTLQ